MIGPMQRQILRVLCGADILGVPGLSCNQIAAVLTDLKIEERNEELMYKYRQRWRPGQINAAMSGLKFVPMISGRRERRSYVVSWPPFTGPSLDRRYRISIEGLMALLAGKGAL